MKEVSDDITWLNMCHHRKCINPESLLWCFILLIVGAVNGLLFSFEID